MCWSSCFIIIIGCFTDPAIITDTDSPASVTVNESETAIFNCTATGVGNLTIEWDVDGDVYNSETCSESTTCGSINSESGNGYVTSTLNITGETDLDISCVVNQNLTFSSENPSIEIRQPPTRTIRGEVAQLTVIPAPTTTTTQSTITLDPGDVPTDGKKDDLLNFTLGQEIVSHRNPLALYT